MGWERFRGTRHLISPAGREPKLQEVRRPAHCGETIFSPLKRHVCAETAAMPPRRKNKAGNHFMDILLGGN
jgi:hypothetical protein